MALSAQLITDTALAIASEFGLGDLSMRRLARELGVQPSALYWHVANKQEVLILVASRFSHRVDAQFRNASPTPQQVAHGLRGVLRDYRDGAEIFLLAYALSGAEVVPAALKAAAGSPALTQRILIFVLGFVAIEQNREMYGVETIASDSSEAQFASHLDAICATHTSEV